MAKKNNKLGTYAGTQYRGGREKGRKNLKKLDNGSYMNQHGVVFTAEEKKALETAVNTANRKRKRMIERTDDLPILLGGQPTGQTQKDLRLMGKTSDFILSQKSKSLQRFKSEDEYHRYMENLKRVNSKDYIDKRIELYKKNIIKAGKAAGVLNNTYKGRKIISMLHSLNNEQFATVAMQEQVFDFTFWDSDTDPMAVQKRERAFDILKEYTQKHNIKPRTRKRKG